MQRHRSRYRIGQVIATSVAFFALTAVISTMALLAGTPQAHALATVPTKINFQGRLTDSTGAVVADGQYNMKFAFYDASTGGNLKWNETRETTNRVQVTGGLFSVKLGDVTPISDPTIFSSGNLYFEITLANPVTATCSTAGCETWESPMNRNQLATSAYAFNSDTLDGLDSSGFIQNQNSSQQANTNFWLSGTGRADTALQAPVLDTAAAGTLSLGKTNATGINVGNISTNIATTINGTTLLKTTAANSTAAFAVQNADGANILAVDTTNTKLTVGVMGTRQNSTILTDAMTSTPSGTLLNAATYVSGQYVELTHNVSSTNGEIEYTPTVNSDFEVNYQFYTSGAADAQYWYGFATSTPVNAGSADGGYKVYFDEWNGKVGLEFNGTVLTSVSQSGINNATWHAVKIRKVGLNIQVSLDGTVVINYNDVARTLTGNKWGLGAWSGGSSAYHRVQGLSIANVVMAGANDVVMTTNGSLNVQSAAANSTSAFTVANMGGTSYFGVDTVNGYLTTNRTDNTGFVFNTPSMTTGGSTLMKIMNNGTAKAAVDYAGNVQGTGFDTLTGGTTLTLGGTNATGGISLAQNTSLAAGKNLTFASGNGGFDQSASTGTFKTSTGANTLGGNTTIASGMSLTVQGAATFQNATNSASAFNINNATNGSVMRVDTTNTRVGINNAAPSASLDVMGSSPAYVNGFESGTLSPFTTSDTTKWNVINTTRAHTGSYVLMGNPNGTAAGSTNYSVSLTQTLNAAGTISFYYMCDWSNASTVSFQIDGGAANSLMTSACVTGTNSSTNYNFASYNVASGSHTFTWTYYIGSFPSTYREYIDDVNITNVGTVGTAALFNGGGIGIGLGTSVMAAHALDVKGDVCFQTGTNTTTAFQLQNAAGASLLTADTVNSAVLFGDTSTAAKLVLSDGSSHNLTLVTATQTGNYTLTIPAQTTNDTVCLQTLANCGVANVGTLDGGSANANGATISGGTLYLQSASATNAGLVNTLTQTFSGAKTFNDNMTLASGKNINLVSGDLQTAGVSRVTSTGQLTNITNYSQTSGDFSLANILYASTTGTTIGLGRSDGGWTQQTNAGTHSWRSVATSSDGTKLAAVDMGGYIYTSTDSGVTWTTRTAAGTHNWFSIVSSSDGTHLAAADNGGYIYTSTDSGVTWTQQTGSGALGWRAMSSSSDGTHLAATGSGMYIYTSTDSGVTWTQQTGSGSYSWNAIAMSSDGTHLAAAVSGNYIYTSTDSGVTWTQQTGSGGYSWTSIAMSSDGTRLAAVVYGGCIYTSTDSGVTWTQRNTPGYYNWYSITSSADGTKLTAAVNGGYIYTSTDSGATWTTQVGAGSRGWYAVAFNSDGSKLIAGSNSGPIYTYVPATTIKLYAGATIGSIGIAGTNISATSNDLTLQTMTSGNIYLNPAGQLYLQGNTLLSAGKYLSIAGGTTATRPASPTEGMVYYDTTTKQLLVYANGKWQADRSPATKVIAMGAASGCTGTSPVASLNPDGADYVTTSCTSAQTAINNAVNALGSQGGTVYLMEGTYIIDGAINLTANVTLTGAGSGTVLKLKDGINANVNLVNISSVNQVAVQNMTLDGNLANNTAGTQDGVYVYSAGSATASGAAMTNLTVRSFRSYGIYMMSGGSDRVSNSTIASNATGVYDNGATNVVIANNTISSNTTSGVSALGNNMTITGNSMQSNATGIYVQGASDTLISDNNIVSSTGTGNNAGIDLWGAGSDNTIENNIVSSGANNGIQLRTSSNHTLVQGNTVESNANAGISVLTVSTNYNTISQNKVYSNANFGIYVNSSSNYITGNTIANSGGSTANNGIYLTSSSSNTIVNNQISDGGASSTNYAINISNVGSSQNYLSGNILGGGSVNDAGTGTQYSNQGDAAGNLVNKNTGGLTLGTSSVTATLSLQGGLNAVALTTPTAPTITTGGTAGTTSYSYTVSALDGTGETIASTAGSTTTGNATLSSTNYNIITWNKVPGAISYNVYRTASAGTPATTGKITASPIAANGNATQALNDTGLAASGTAPAGNTTGGGNFAGSLQSAASISVGTAGSVTGTIVLKTSANTNALTLLSAPQTGNFTLTIPALTANDTVCLQTLANCTSGKTRTITLVPAYPGSVVHADGSNNGGTMTNDFVGALSSAQGYKHNYYQWTSSNATAQHEDIIVNTALPSEYASGLGNLQVWAASSDTTNATGTIQVQDATGNSCYASPVAITPSANATWQQISAGAFSGCTFAANDIITITIHTVAANSANIQVGEVTFGYTN